MADERQAVEAKLETELETNLEAGRKYGVMRIWPGDIIDFLASLLADSKRSGVAGGEGMLVERPAFLVVRVPANMLKGSFIVS